MEMPKTSDVAKCRVNTKRTRCKYICTNRDRIGVLVQPGRHVRLLPQPDAGSREDNQANPSPTPIELNPEGHIMNKRLFSILALSSMTLFAAPAWADEYQDTIAVFRKAEESGKFFANAAGYAVFPTIGKAGIGIGGAYGKGRVYRAGKVIGDVSMTQLSFGAQLGGEGFSQIVFFENEAALKKFTQSEFEFGVQAQAVVITLGASAQGGTAGGTAGASVTKDKAKVVGAYNNGMAIFTVIKGGLMYEISAAGQKFKFKPR
jgi:hypothetical protein